MRVEGSEFDIEEARELGLIKNAINCYADGVFLGRCLLDPFHSSTPVFVFASVNLSDFLNRFGREYPVASQGSLSLNETILFKTADRIGMNS